MSNNSTAVFVPTFFKAAVSLLLVAISLDALADHGAGAHIDAGLTISPPSNGSFTVSWDVPPLGTIVELQQFNGSYYPSGDFFLDPNVTTKVFTNVADGTYQFRIVWWSCIISECGHMDFSEPVAVLIGASAAPVHIVTQGDFDFDGALDLAVVAPVSSIREVDDFILRNVGNGDYTVVTNPTGSQISAARGWPAIGGSVRVADVNLDLVKDVIIEGLTTIDDYVIWSADNQAANYPTRALRLTADVANLVSDLAGVQSNPDFFANALTTQTVTTSGYYLVMVFVTTPGYYFDEHGIWRFFGIGFHKIIVFLTITDTIEVLDPNVVSSPEAYDIALKWDVFETGTDTQVADAIADILIILKGVLNTDIGVPEIRPPWGSPDDAPAVIIPQQIVLEELCMILGAECGVVGLEVVDTVGLAGICLDALSPLELAKTIDPGSYVMPSVDHPSNQNFAITAGQLSDSLGSADSNRRAFWQSRLDISKDPLAPLALDVVDNEFLLGCLANERYSKFASENGVSDSLTDVGILIMRGHRDLTDLEVANLGPFLIGKLGPRQVADYHFEVFNGIGLPNRTFGGTPFTGNRNEARLTGLAFCPSCDDD